MKSLAVGKLYAQLNRIQLDFGLEIESFEIHGDEATVHIEPYQLVLPKPGSAKAVVTQAAVAAMLEHQSPGGLRDFRVTAEGGLLYITAKAQIVVQIPVKVAARLVIVQEKQLHVELESVDVMGAGGKNLVEGQLAKINPIFDTAQLPIDLRLRDVETEAGRVILTGEVLS
ncbi:LmeA family phospholipid-binding protein [Kamptonema cortianum]|nr:LmeA family phospholipid-binding protein [Geitlerinema splendidum]MDK3156162.1 LmeA family phospholipid-binding protein [Kamptonema cortianum]